MNPFHIYIYIYIYLYLCLHLSDCRSLYREIPNKRIEHVYWEDNQCADALARLGSSVISSFAVFVVLPPVVVSLLAFDEVDSFCNC